MLRFKVLAQPILYTTQTNSH